MGFADGTGANDHVLVQLHEVVEPPPADEPLVPQTEGDQSPTQQAAQATVETTGADPPPRCACDACLSLPALLIEVRSLRAEVSCLHNARRALAARVHVIERWVDLQQSSLLKRLWWWGQGYRWRTLGRWYPPSWSD